MKEITIKAVFICVERIDIKFKITKYKLTRNANTTGPDGTDEEEVGYFVHA